MIESPEQLNLRCHNDHAADESGLCANDGCPAYRGIQSCPWCEGPVFRDGTCDDDECGNYGGDVA